MDLKRHEVVIETAVPKKRILQQKRKETIIHLLSQWGRWNVAQGTDICTIVGRMTTTTGSKSEGAKRSAAAEELVHGGV